MLNKFILAKSEKKQSIFKTMRDKLYDNLYDGMIIYTDILKSIRLYDNLYGHLIIYPDMK